MREEVSLVIVLVSVLAVQSILANSCMSARSSATGDADCYLNHLARENIMRMGTEGGCDQPRQQIVYPDDTGKMYMPRGTLLFRCNDQSGCCGQKEHSCQPLQEEELRVAFFTMDCSAGDTRPKPEYVIMKNHTKCGCRPPVDDAFDQGPQRLQDMVCGGSRGGYQMRGSSYGANGYGRDRGYGDSRGGNAGYGQNAPALGYAPQSPGYPGQQSYAPPGPSGSPCANSMSSRPLADGQVVRGTIRITVGPKGFQSQQSHQQQQPCPYG